MSLLCPNIIVVADVSTKLAGIPPERLLYDKSTYKSIEFNSPIISIIRDNENSIIILTENDIYIHPFYFGKVVYKPIKIEVPFNPYIIDYNNGIFVLVDKSSNLYFSIDNGCTWRKIKKINLPNISYITHDDKERFVILNNEPLSKDYSNNGIYFLY